MTQALIIGLVTMVAYGLFLLVKASLLLYRMGEKKLICSLAVFMVAAPLLIWFGSILPERYTSLWTVLPTLILFVLWLCAGYFLESYRKQKEKLCGMGIDKRPIAPPGLLRRNAVVLGVGLIIWLYGAFFGISDSTVETCALCVSVFLLTSGISSFWKYRKF